MEVAAGTSETSPRPAPNLRPATSPRLETSTTTGTITEVAVVAEEEVAAAEVDEEAAVVAEANRDGEEKAQILYRQALQPQHSTGLCLSRLSTPPSDLFSVLWLSLAFFPQRHRHFTPTLDVAARFDTSAHRSHVLFPSLISSVIPLRCSAVQRPTLYC